MTLRFMQHELEKAAGLLLSGHPVAIPTETVYGLAAPIFNLKAIRELFSLKGRPQDNPLIAHVSSIGMVETIAQNIPPLFYRLAGNFWPGPLTLILERKECVPDLVTAGQGSIAIRMPAHPIALRLIDLVGTPLVAPSANISGKPSPTSAAHVLEDFDGKLAAVVDGGSCQVGIESTVLNLLTSSPTLLRPGSITKSQIEQALGREISLPKEDEPTLSPGMKYRHYAPKGTLHLVESLPPIYPGIFLLSSKPIAGCTYRKLNAKELYSHLRKADQLGIAEIWILIDPIISKDFALMNRLQKAASKM